MALLAKILLLAVVCLGVAEAGPREDALAALGSSPNAAAAVADCDALTGEAPQQYCYECLSNSCFQNNAWCDTNVYPKCAKCQNNYYCYQGLRDAKFPTWFDYNAVITLTTGCNNSPTASTTVQYTCPYCVRFCRFDTGHYDYNCLQVCKRCVTSGCPTCVYAAKKFDAGYFDYNAMQACPNAP